MSRLSRKAVAARLAEPHWEASLRISERPPQGYTANTVVTEWMTLHCRGDWASQSAGAGRILVWWFSEADHDRACATLAFREGGSARAITRVRLRTA